jgi:dTMP kinase
VGANALRAPRPGRRRVPASGRGRGADGARQGSEAAQVPARLISLEGGERSGKSTQLALLSAHLERRGVAFVLTREPGGTPFGERLRGVLLSPELGPVSPVAEMIAFAASRAEVVARVIRPALARGQVVIADRFVDSSRAYQGYGLGVPLADIDVINRAATGGLEPDLTLLFDVDPAVAAARAPERGPDRIEARAADFHARVRAGYLELAAREPQRFLVLDARRPASELAAAVARAVDACIEGRTSGNDRANANR